MTTRTQCQKCTSRYSNISITTDATSTTTNTTSTINTTSKLIKFNSKHQHEVQASEVLSFIEEVDALRRNNRFNSVIRILEASKESTSGTKDIGVPWDMISKELALVKPSSVKLKDKEIKEDLRYQRLKIIDGMLKKNG